MQLRNFKIDNIRFILIYLVVLGHFLELVPGKTASDIYKIIYSFHMPAFLFITGFFAYFNRKKIILTLIYPYIVFQILYQLFDTFVLSNSPQFSVTFGQPYWLLWYLLVTIFCYLLLPLFDSSNPKTRIAFFVISIILSLLVGYDTSIGYYGSLARFFSFLPFFLAGYYVHNISVPQKDYVWFLLPIGAFLFFSCYYLINTPEITNHVLYASYSYRDAGHNPLIKAILLLISFAWICFLFLSIPNKKLPFITLLGQHTFSIFLLHGFIVKLTIQHSLFQYTDALNICLALALSLIIVCITGNPWTSKLFSRLFTGARLKH